jgi:hypothetical protein
MHHFAFMILEIILMIFFFIFITKIVIPKTKQKKIKIRAMLFRKNTMYYYQKIWLVKICKDHSTF